VLFVPAGRSPASVERARDAGLEPSASLAGALAASDAVLSVCPPQAAEDVAREVLAHGFRGVYVDANAISPERALRIGAACAERGAVLVDGGIVGPPPGPETGPRLYLSGPRAAADRIAAVFDATAVEVRTLDAEPGAASALKMAYAAFQKSSRALAAVSHALATQHGVGDELAREARSMTPLILADTAHLPSVAARAWRWAPEMEEIAATLRADGLPPNLAEASAAVFRHWTADKDQYRLPLTDVLAHLRSEPAAADDPTPPAGD
jgi:3-hydroxyisobutyrate dehydrogenase-like beta-hydroxyacid dehydrogenase